MSGTSPDPVPDLTLQTSPGPPSVISSRMTDVNSEDSQHPPRTGSPAPSHPRSTTVPGTPTQTQTPKRRSLLASERPETARTGTSSRGWSAATPLRKQHLQHTIQSGTPHRGSVSGASTRTNVTGLSRSGSKGHNSRSHVPSVANQAFFHPISSQKLQAQRASTAGRRPSETPSMPGSGFNVGTPPEHSAAAAAANFSAGLARMGDGEEVEERPPPSRGTAWTEQETLDRLTANASPTGNMTHESFPESMKPLQRRRDREGELKVDTSRQYNLTKTSQAVRTQIMSPQRTPKSFRSSLFIPNAGPNRDTTGAEKLSSAAPSESHEDDFNIKHAPQSDRVKNETKAEGKVYEYFDGNTVFCLGGRMQNTHAKPINIATGVLTALPVVLFLIFPGPWLWRHVSPAIPVIFGYLGYICLSSFLRASTSDPGILPRNLHAFPEPDPSNPSHQHVTNDWVLMKSVEASTEAMEVPVKHCRTCNIWRPPRAHHCRLCDNCVEGHDHHCVWLNNCVGRRNYRFFFAYVGSATVLSVFMVGTCIAQLVMHMNDLNISFGKAIGDYPMTLALIIYGVLAGMYPTALMGYHVFLMSRGETTREYINSHKFPKAERYRAFTQGQAWRNWMVVLCRPRPVQFYQFKQAYQPGDQRLGTVRHTAKKRDSVELQNVRPVGAGDSGFQGPTALRAEQKGEER